MGKRDLLYLLPFTALSLSFSLHTLYVGDYSHPARRKSLGRSGPNDPELTRPTPPRSLIRFEVLSTKAIQAEHRHALLPHPLDTPLLGGTSDSGSEAEKDLRPAARVLRS